MRARRVGAWRVPRVGGLAGNWVFLCRRGWGEVRGSEGGAQVGGPKIWGAFYKRQFRLGPSSFSV